MDTDRAFLIICLTVGAVILFNVMIYLSLRRGHDRSTQPSVLLPFTSVASSHHGSGGPP